MKNEPRYIVVVGTSAGGFTTLIDLVNKLNPALDAAYFIVLHLSGQSISGFLAHKLQQHTQLKCILAMDGLPIQRGYIYVAMPNHHLMVSPEGVRLSRGASENRWRPSIDVLFRSAATHFSTRVIGIVLTGLLNDGTTGMSAIKRSGGIGIVQDPNEAEYPDMPLSVLSVMEVDYVRPVAEIGPLLTEIMHTPPPPERKAPDDVVKENEMSADIITDIRTTDILAARSVYTCPECGGLLWEHDHDAVHKFKCHVGHSYTTRDLLIAQSQEAENSLWYAIRSLEQRRNLLETLAGRYERSGNKYFATDYKKRADEIGAHVDNLKKILGAQVDLPEEL